MDRVLKKSSNLNDDILYSIMINSSIDVLKNMCMTNQQAMKYCRSKTFWNDKLINNQIPVIPIDDKYIDRYLDNLEVTIDKFWEKMYSLMVHASEIAKGILLINKIEKNRNYNKSNGVIEIHVYDSYEGEGNHAIYLLEPIFDISIEYSPNIIKITLRDIDYKLEYTVLNIETNDNQTYSKIVSKKEIIRILTLFLFDSYTLKYLKYV